VLGYDEDGSSEDDDLELGTAESDGGNYASEREKDDDDEENLRDWGTSKADYYDADIIETEADALEEEQEARRLQQKHLQNLTNADFGFDENQWIEEDTTTRDELRRDTFTERLPELEVKEDASSEEKARILKSRYPEFEPLAKDFVELPKVYQELSLAAEAAEAVVNMKDAPSKSKTGATVKDMQIHKASIATSKLRALSAYLGSVGMYFALLTSTTNPGPNNLAMSPAELRDHPVVQSLLRSRQLWEELKDVVVPQAHVVAREAEANGLEQAAHAHQVNGTIKSNDINGGTDANKKRRTKAERAAIKAQELAEAGRQVQMQKTEAKLAELDVLMSAKRKEARQRPIETGSRKGNDSDFGDEEALTTHEAAEKAQRKKSLRFYTSQIAQKSNKRGTASRDAGGDADLPYKERLKDRQARLMREAERRGRSEGEKDELLGNEGSGDDAEDVHLAKEIRGDDADEDGYYDLVSTRTKQKKDERKALAEAQARAAREGGQVYVEEEVGADGKRAITYAIAKNKGLAPRRKKEVRNPRVKKKIRYEQKLKKLGSIKPIYKGGEGRGGYGGELTGIKTNVLKGVKL
jgi:U3 small nucleolar RNA-associated protein 3